LLFECIPYDTVTDNVDEAELSEQGNQEGSSLPAHFEPHGADKDSEKRQRAAIEAYTKTSGYEIAETFYDAAVSGADPVSERSGFAEMLERLMSNGARTIIVESPDRFARDLMVLAGHDMLKARGVTLIAASAPTLFVEDTPTAVLVRQAWAPSPSSKDDPCRQIGGGAQAEAVGNWQEGRPSRYRHRLPRPRLWVRCGAPRRYCRDQESRHRSLGRTKADCAGDTGFSPSPTADLVIAGAQRLVLRRAVMRVSGFDYLTSSPRAARESPLFARIATVHCAVFERPPAQPRG
jgi:resolvase-like protein